MDEAKAALGRIRRRGVEVKLQDLAASTERKDKRQWKRLSHSPLLVINIAFQFIQRVIGLDSIVYFGPMFLQSTGYFYHASFLAPFIVSVIQTRVAEFTYPTYTFFGKWRTLISTYVGMFLAQVCLLGLFLASGDPIYNLSAQSSYIATTFAIP